MKDAKQFLTQFLEFAKKFGKNIDSLIGALITRPSDVFNTFFTGASDGVEEFVTTLPDKLPEILYGWLFPNTAQPEGKTVAEILTMFLDEFLDPNKWSIDHVWDLLVQDLNLSPVIDGWEFLNKADFAALLDLTDTGLLEKLAPKMIEKLQTEVLKKVAAEVVKIFAIPGLAAAEKAFGIAKVIFVQADKFQSFLDKVSEGVEELVSGNSGRFAKVIVEALKKAIPLILSVIGAIFKVDIPGTVSKLKAVIQDPLKVLLDPIVMKIKQKIKELIPNIGGQKRDNVLGGIQSFVFNGQRHSFWVQVDAQKKSSFHFSSPVEGVAAGKILDSWAMKIDAGLTALANKQPTNGALSQKTAIENLQKVLKEIFAEMKNKLESKDKVLLEDLVRDVKGLSHTIGEHYSSNLTLEQFLDESSKVKCAGGPTATSGVLTDPQLTAIYKCLVNGFKIVLPGNASYFLNGGTYNTDKDGKLTKAEFTITSLKAGGRNSKITAAIGKLGKFGDVGFHLLGDQFGGSTYYPNIIPANGKSFTEEEAATIGGTEGKSFNLSAYKILENAWKRAADKGLPVAITISMAYSGDDLRPSIFTFDFTVNGTKIGFSLQNQAGDEIPPNELVKLNTAIG